MLWLNSLFGSFNSTGSYYFDRLTNSQKNAYTAIVSGIDGFASEIKLPLMPVNEISMIVDCVRLDNPLFFYVSSTFNYVKDLSKNKCIVRLDYKYPRSFVRQTTNTIMTYLRVFDTVKSGSDVDKEIYVHDYCLNNFHYDNSFGDDSHSILGPILNKTAVCEGIAKFVKLSLDHLGVKNLVVCGKARNPIDNSTLERHAWNIVFVEGRAYHLDVTFDMTVKGKVNRYDYFNLADEDIKDERTIISNTPACSTIGNDYMTVNALVANSPTELEKMIGTALRSGKKNVLVKLKNIKDTATIADKVMVIAQQQYGSIYNRDVTVAINYNPSQWVFELNFV